jgi:hypothetical protein
MIATTLCICLLSDDGKVGVLILEQVVTLHNTIY